MCRSLSEGGRRCPACARGPVRNARQAAYRAAIRARHVRIDQAGLVCDDGYRCSDLPPAQLADRLGYQEQPTEVTPELQAWAVTQVDKVRDEVKAAAARIVEDLEGQLDKDGIGRGSIKRPEHKAYDQFARRWVNRQGGDWDWYFEDLTEPEKDRLRKNWFAGAGNSTAWSADELDERMPVRDWLEVTRQVDAAVAITHGRIVNPNGYGGNDATDLIDSPYDLRKLFGGREEAAETIAEAEARADEDEAWLFLPRCKHGPAPWEMTETEYLLESVDLELRISTMQPETVDIDPDTGEDWSSFSKADEAVLDRYRELVPTLFEDAKLDLPHRDVEAARYRAMLKLARKGGMV